LTLVRKAKHDTDCTELTDYTAEKRPEFIQSSVLCSWETGSFDSFGYEIDGDRLLIETR